MNESKIKLANRTELYEQVWSKPMIKLAVEYGLSDNGLRKICKKLKVPMPKAGYWQKIQHGIPINRVPLPDFDGKADVEIKQNDKTEQTQRLDLPAEIASEYLPENKIHVSKALDKPHPFIQSLKKDLNRREKYLQKGMIWSHRGEIHVHVAPESVDRALRILDALIKALEKRGRKVILEKKDETKCSSCVVWEDEILPISIYEKHRVVKKLEKKSPFDSDHDYIPSGVLVLRIGAEYWNERNAWKDTKTKTLEEKLNSFIVGLYEEYKERKDRKLYWENERRKDEEKRVQLEELHRKRQIELEKIQTLEKDASNWHKSQLIRAYIKEKERVFSEEKIGNLSGNEFKNWLNWAKNHADSLDPLRKNVQVEKVEES